MEKQLDYFQEMNKAINETQMNMVKTIIGLTQVMTMVLTWDRVPTHAINM
jgi:hypothetical protein